ncbi:unnamed protein product [Paramecium sonneborni]|uniref:Uncharacterized protein n=1 Tax=Paramecium sonneborni TaxID=65129 RepID=A0A8S1MAS9_9CILI|nr:unnamed protein product [Paramecium sonneborni]
MIDFSLKQNESNLKNKDDELDLQFMKGYKVKNLLAKEFKIKTLSKGLNGEHESMNRLL